MNIHIFDGKLHESINEIRAEIIRVQALSLEQRNEIFGHFYSKLEPHLNIRCRHVLRTVIAADGNPTNYDRTNNVRADDMLLLVAGLNIDLADLAAIFQEQLQDMASGMCPQGRATRMVQIYLALIE